MSEKSKNRRRVAYLTPPWLEPYSSVQPPRGFLSPEVLRLVHTEQQLQTLRGVIGSKCAAFHEWYYPKPVALVAWSAQQNLVLTLLRSPSRRATFQQQGKRDEHKQNTDPKDGAVYPEAAL